MSLPKQQSASANEASFANMFAASHAKDHRKTHPSSNEADDECNDTNNSSAAKKNKTDAGGDSDAVRVYLNVYNLLEANKESAKGLGVEALNLVGMGIHHSGVEVFGEEWSFGGDPTGRNDPKTDGIFSVYPRTACGFFKEQIDLGPAPPTLTEERLATILDTLRPKWRCISYHILSHNCNAFSRTLIEAIDALWPAGTPEEKKLVAKVPGWVNRASGVGAALVPNALVQKITDSLSPPGACAPDLVNFIDIPAYDSGPMPPPLPPMTLPAVAARRKAEAEETAAAKSGGGGGFGLSSLANLASKAASVVKNAVISQVDEMDKKDYVEQFGSEGARAEDLMSAYKCTVIHINRPQSAKVFIATDCIRISGDHNLKLKLSFLDIRAYHFGAVVRPQRSDGNALPQFIPTADMNKTDCILLFFDRIEGRPHGPRMIPLLDLSFLGTLLAFSSSPKEIAQNAMCYIDVNYRQYRQDLGR